MNTDIATNIYRTILASCLVFVLQPAAANIGDYYVFTLTDGKTVEGKLVADDAGKVEVEQNLRGIIQRVPVLRNKVADFKMLSAAEVQERTKAAARPAASSTAPAFPTAPQVAFPGQAAGDPTQLIQQGRQLLGQGRVSEAIQILERAVGSGSDSNTPSEPRELLRQAYAAWMQSLQNSRQQLAAQVDLAKQQVEQTQKTVDANQKTLADLQKQLVTPPSHHGDWYDNSARNEARNRIPAVQVSIMTDTIELNKRSATLARLVQQLATLDQQIATAQGRLAEQFAVVQASYGADDARAVDVTAVVQSKIKDGSLTICVDPESFGLSKEGAGDGKLKITYAIGSERKSLTVLSGWTLTLPLLKLAPPTTVPELAPPSNQLIAPPSNQLKIRRALYDKQDVTAYLQNMVKADSLTVRVLPELFGLSAGNIQDGRLFITYTVGGEEKSVTIESGWTIQLPSLLLTPPETPWYVANLKWILGGLVALWILSKVIRISR